MGSSSTIPDICFPEDNVAFSTALIEQFPSPGEGNILILDDTNFHLASNIACFFNPQDILVTTSLSQTFISDPSLENVRILWGLHHPYQTIICEPPENSFSWSKIRCILWFPNLNGQDENLDQQAAAVQRFFEYMAIRILANHLYNVRVVLTMNNIRFSQLLVRIFFMIIILNLNDSVLLCIPMPST